MEKRKTISVEQIVNLKVADEIFKYPIENKSKKSFEPDSKKIFKLFCSRCLSGTQ